MCTVQVLLMTDIGGRAVRPNPNPPRSICRRLFADDLSNALPSPSEFLGRLREDIEKKDKERWNFDFRTETPLPGRYQWVPLRPGAESAPRTRKESVLVTEVRKTTHRKDSQEKTKDSPSPSLRQSSNLGKSTTQSKITDFLLQRKRQRAVSSDLDSPKLKSRRIYAERSADIFSCRSSAT